MKKLLLLLGLCLYVFNGFAQSNAANQSKDFDQFWKKWHTAIMKKDYNAVSQFIEFPLVIKRGEGANAIQTVAKNDFATFFKSFLDEPMHDDQSRFTVLRGMKDLNEEDKMLVDGDSATINDMEFEKVDGTWKLVYIYQESQKAFAGTKAKN
ncbi:hypothetical protein LX64_02728 [Chitinophaga skermanii]|uniref:Nuclear transport factor 2 family protein n=1 Tax=Chitinophaga skermanii TaxID=331697 RepID=A0A327QHN2_9BACT|nr:hypothetical protein [Chitinophaga skermanii]RAJ03851.1 hypothetical protein LX64_02728 [Chitinophaga skermanii]